MSTSRSSRCTFRLAGPFHTSRPDIAPTTCADPATVGSKRPTSSHFVRRTQGRRVCRRPDLPADRLLPDARIRQRAVSAGRLLSRNDSVGIRARTGTEPESFRKGKVRNSKLQGSWKWNGGKGRKAGGSAGTFRCGPPARSPTLSDFLTSSLELRTSLEFGVSLLPDRCARVPAHQRQLHRSG